MRTMMMIIVTKPHLHCGELPLNVWNSAYICHLWHCTAKQRQKSFDSNRENFWQNRLCSPFPKWWANSHFCAESTFKRSNFVGSRKWLYKIHKGDRCRWSGPVSLAGQHHQQFEHSGGGGQMLRRQQLHTMLRVGQQQVLNRKRRLGPSWLNTILNCWTPNPFCANFLRDAILWLEWTKVSSPVLGKVGTPDGGLFEGLYDVGTLDLQCWVDFGGQCGRSGEVLQLGSARWPEAAMTSLRVGGEPQFVEKATIINWKLLSSPMSDSCQDAVSLFIDLFTSLLSGCHWWWCQKSQHCSELVAGRGHQSLTFVQSSLSWLLSCRWDQGPVLMSS